MLHQIMRRLRARANECYFWATHAGAELDLLVVSGRKRRGFEIKRTESPKITPSIRVALDTLRLDRIDVVHAGPRSFPLAKDVHALAANDLMATLEPLRPD
jgi:hypothetical protein